MAEVIANRATVVPALAHIGIEPQGPGELLVRQCGLVELLRDQAVIVEGNIGSLIELDRPRDERLGLGEPVRVHESDRQQVQRRNMRRLGLDDAPEALFGLREIACIQGRERLIEDCCDVLHRREQTSFTASGQVQWTDVALSTKTMRISAKSSAGSVKYPTLARLNICPAPCSHRAKAAENVIQRAGTISAEPDLTTLQGVLASIREQQTGRPGPCGRMRPVIPGLRPIPAAERAGRLRKISAISIG
nr:hypothetical protein [Bradyrhizobium sp. Bra78]